MPHVESENQNAQEHDCREDISEHEALIVALDTLLDLALEIALEGG
jgi:hypothetical protein